MDYLLFSVVLATIMLGFLMLLYSAFKILASCHKGKSTRKDLEGSFPRQKQSEHCYIDEKKGNYLVVNSQDCNSSDSFIEMTNETSLQTSSYSASNVSMGSENDSGIHEYEDETHRISNDSIDFNKGELTLNSSFQSLDLPFMFREADAETEEDNSDSKLGFSDHLLVEIDINDDLDADSINIESEIQDSFTIKTQPKCESTRYSDYSFPTPTLYGLINKLSYFYCL